MPQSSLDTCPLDSPPSIPQGSADQRELESNDQSYLESFLNSFFQEKNIKWMLVVGAAIVLGSSLMLVTKAWPQWTPALKYLTILVYTGTIFLAAEVCRKRLRLSATYRVLHALTLLLLPISFLSLTWVSSGTAVQNGLHAIRDFGLLIPAIGLLWFASRTILDHWLRGRQTTFLISFVLLCIAGVVPPITSPAIAAAFAVGCWLVFTIGVMKVNRHTFWLAEEYQLPRVFGFLPIAMLGSQFVILIGTKAINAVPMQWIGFAVVMVAATVLMTARTVAEVYRRRTGDLVRPLPWTIAVPMFGGVVLTALGVVLSMSGFSYVGETTYALIPSAIVAAFLFGMVARDTRHPGFVWITLIVVAIAYQCSPVLFSDFVATVRSATADAIHRDRVPFSMYGLTYLPLLGILVACSRRFQLQQRLEFSRPIKHFVTVVAITLFGIALTDMTSLFFVASANCVAFVVFAIAFADRRYLVPSIIGLVAAWAVAIPVVTEMGYASIDLSWIATGLAGLGVLLTVSEWPDRLANKIPVGENGRWMRRSDGRDRKFYQSTGFALTTLVAIHWMLSSVAKTGQPLTMAAMVQFAFLIFALVIYVLRTPNYFAALGGWVLTGYAIIRWAIGLDFPLVDLAHTTTLVLIGCSMAAYLMVAYLVVQRGNVASSFSQLRRSLGLAINPQDDATLIAAPLGPVSKRIAVFFLPLFDLAVAGLLVLLACLYGPSLLFQHVAWLFSGSAPMLGFSLVAIAGLVWMSVVAWRLRNVHLQAAAACTLPIVVTSSLISLGVQFSFESLLLVWASVQCLLMFASRSIENHTIQDSHSVRTVAQAWLVGLLAISCLSFDLPMRCVAMLAIASLAWQYRKQSNQGQVSLAIITNIQLLLLAAALGGCHGWLMHGFMPSISFAAVAPVFLTGCVSVLAFDYLAGRWQCTDCKYWASVLRGGAAVLMATAFVGPQFGLLMISAMTVGMAVLAVAEILQAINLSQDTGQQEERRVWSACALIGIATGFLFAQGVISIGAGLSQFVLLGLSIAGLSIALFAERNQKIQILQRPMLWIGLSLPAIVAFLAIGRVVLGISGTSPALGALALMIAAGIYFHQSYVMHREKFWVPGLIIANAGLFLSWRSLGWTAPELYLVPIGMSILVFVELMKRELPKPAHDPLRYIAALTILCSPLLEVVGGDWIHILTLLVLSVLVILVAIGLRIRSLVYAGSAFLFADLVAMVIRSTIHNVNLLWICGVVLGVGVIALAAFCENHRGKLLTRIRFVSAELATWN
ncbi:hypothetical protein LF1_39260 [Rubripirellula obstinata]|uniref:Uncharacterized protein n=1 Tax=Rubripirellula obstinata TaxID=406547 RepID=A0A5B1CNK5_9BACT|nr:hypothetical protein [Rubripirellula obstinata]KAA1261379.1 hypothetical protein LF1_39260 [Rubripirellula obstinata]